MRRNFLRSLVICLVPTLIAAAFVGWAGYKESKDEGGFRKGIDLAGGTILIYEVKSGDLESDQIKQLADKLKKRIDENDLKNVIVRPLGRNRVEIILPFAGGSGGKEGANAEFVEDVRQKVKQTGVLEFRIVANAQDDAAGIEAAANWINDPANQDLLRDKAKQGLPPPAPTDTFGVKAAGDTEEQVAYEWVELGKEERESMGLSQQYKDQGKLRTNKDGSTYYDTAYKALELSRGRAVPYQGGLMYSRRFPKDEFLRDEAGKLTDKKDPDFMPERVRGKDEQEVVRADGTVEHPAKEVEYYILTRKSPADTLQVTGDVRISAEYHPTSEGNKGPAVGFTFTSGGNRFYELTKRNKPTGFERQLAVAMDGKIVSIASLRDALPGRGQISGNFDAKSANQLISILRSGDLNAELKPDPVSENTVGPTLGQTTIQNGLIAVAASFIAVLLFMVVYYRFAGFVACVALFINLLMTVGFMVAMNAAFTLPGLAGIVLMLGMAVDANVLIYERLREEREKGATLAAAIRNGYDRALPTIIDTHLTSIFTSVVLYTFGNDALKGFSVSLAVGLIISLFTSLFITRLMFDFWMHKKWLTQLKMLKLFARPKFDFMKIRHAMFGLTAFLTVAGLVLFLARGEKVLNVDFTQGTAYGGRLAAGKEKTLSESLTLLGEEQQKKRLAGAAVTKVDGTDNVYQVSYPPSADGLIKEGEQTRLTLANKPEGATDAEQLANLTARLSGLPDVSVEQVFLAADKFDGGRSRSFTVRTTEKEKEVVQVVLDRLLRDADGPLLTTFKAKRPFAYPDPAKPVLRVEFEHGNGTPLVGGEGVSPAYFRDFVVRELRTNPATAGDADKVTVKGVISADAAVAAEEGRAQRYKAVAVDFSNVQEVKKRFEDPARVEEGKAFVDRDILAPAVKTFEARPVPDRLETFDPSLAKDTRSKALMAILLSWVAILAYLWFRFGSWQFGLAAVICLIHDLCFTLGAIAVCHYLHDNPIGHVLGLKDFKIDLAAVAALLTLVGYSVNDTIVVFDRIREVRGKNPVLTTQMINDSVNQTLSRTILAALTVFLVVVVLYIWGGEGVHLFAFVMVMGVIVGTYSSIYIASPLLLVFGEGKPKAGLPGGGPTGDTPTDQPAESDAASAIAS